MKPPDRPAGIPDDWVCFREKEGQWVFGPTNINAREFYQVRFTKAEQDATHVSKRVDNWKIKYSGQYHDAKGNPVKLRSNEAHISSTKMHNAVTFNEIDSKRKTYQKFLKAGGSRDQKNREKQRESIHTEQSGDFFQSLRGESHISKSNTSAPSSNSRTKENQYEKTKDRKQERPPQTILSDAREQSSKEAGRAGTERGKTRGGEADKNAPQDMASQQKRDVESYGVRDRAKRQKSHEKNKELKGKNWSGARTKQSMNAQGKKANSQHSKEPQSPTPKAQPTKPKKSALSAQKAKPFTARQPKPASPQEQNIKSASNTKKTTPYQHAKPAGTASKTNSDQPKSGNPKKAQTQVEQTKNPSPSASQKSSLVCQAKKPSSPSALPGKIGQPAKKPSGQSPGRVEKTGQPLPSQKTVGASRKSHVVTPGKMNGSNGTRPETTSPKAPKAEQLRTSAKPPQKGKKPVSPNPVKQSETAGKKPSSSSNPKSNGSAASKRNQQIKANQARAQTQRRARTPQKGAAKPPPPKSTPRK